VQETTGLTEGRSTAEFNKKKGYAGAGGLN